MLFSMFMKSRGSLLLTALLCAATGCDSDASSSADASGDTSADATGTATSYKPFSLANAEGYIARVNAHSAMVALLDGNGFTMTLDDDRVHALATPFAPFAFAGEARVAVTLVDGPTRDFNLMVRRAWAHGDIRVWREPGTQIPDPSTVLVYCARGVIDTIEGSLHAGDAWRPSPVSPVKLQHNALALIIRIEPHTT